MPTFAYKARAADGNVLTGTIEAGQSRQVHDRLRGQKLTVLEVSEKAPSVFKTAKEAILGKPKVGSKDLVLFSRQLSTLVSAGVPIVQGLSILEDQAENPTFRDVIAGVRSDIEAGLSISDALKKHPDAFPEVYTSM